MRVENAILAVLTAGVWLWAPAAAGEPPILRLCGRRLSDIMSRVCQEYNRPLWDINDPAGAFLQKLFASATAREQAVESIRRKRDTEGGIADLCCKIGCTWTQLTDFCAGADMELIERVTAEQQHYIKDRSAESTASAAEVRVARRRAGRRRVAASSEAPVDVERAAPVVGTVSPLLTWGRTLNTDLPYADPERFAYVAVYAQPRQ